MTNPNQIAADSALAIELLGQFFASQIDAGAVLREEVAAAIRTAADRIATDSPALAATVTHRAEQIITRLPAGWAEGDGDWSEPA